MAKDTLVGVDVGGTKIEAASADLEGRLRHRVTVPTPAGGKESILQEIFAGIRAVTEGRGISLQRVAGIGVASAGPLDAEAGVVWEAPNIPGWENVPLVAIVQEEFGLPVALERDANAAALAERRWGRGADDMVYITVSTGIGGGLILGGKLYRGAGGTAGEIGHTTIDINGPACYRGHRGCVEALASGTAIARMAREKMAEGRETVLCSLGEAEITAKEVKWGATQGDPMCLEIFNEAGTALGIAIANLANLLNPSLVVLGGGVMQPPDFMLPSARKALAERAFRKPAEMLRVELTALGKDVTLRGALLKAMEACGCASPS